MDTMVVGSASRLLLAEEEMQGPGLDSGDTAWLLTSTALVLLMSIPGLALFYAGLVRSKNVLMQMNYIFATAAEITLLWFLYGYSISFSDSNMAAGRYNLNSFFGTLAHGGMRHMGDGRLVGTVPANVFAMFQLTFAIITVGLISGAYAERLKFSAMLLFNALWFTSVYCPLAHMVWGGAGAFIHSLGALDFAGGLVVHISSGFAGLLVAVALGKRKGYPRIPKAPHSLVITSIGASMLWVGWFGFNAGSALAADGAAALAMLVTMAAAAAASLSWMTTEWLTFERPSTLGLVSGAIAGLVAITPASGSVNFYGALCIGGLAGPVSFVASTWLKEKIDMYDDSLDVFGIHGVAGMLGELLVAVWCAPGLGGSGFGTFIPREGKEEAIDNIGWQLGMQAISICICVAWVVVATTVCLKITDVLHGGLNWRLFCGLTAMRCSAADEDIGMDESTFAESGYNYAASDFRISVEVGPLRGRKGHGLQLYYTTPSGTTHPVPVDGSTSTRSADDLSHKLMQFGGKIDLGLDSEGNPVLKRDSSAHYGEEGAGASRAGGEVEVVPLADSRPEDTARVRSGH